MRDDDQVHGLGTSVTPLDPGDFLLEDYEQKVAYLTNHFSRMWMRFNFFVSLETAIAGGGLILFGDRASPVAVGGGGVVLSLLWHVMGAQDRYLVDLYRWQVSEAGRTIANALRGGQQMKVGSIRYCRGNNCS